MLNKLIDDELEVFLLIMLLVILLGRSSPLSWGVMDSSGKGWDHRGRKTKK